MSDVDRLTLLQLARDTLRLAITLEHRCPECSAPIDWPAPQLPAVVRELRAVLTEIDAIPGSGEVSDLDRLADRVTDDLEARRKRRTTG